MNKNNELQVGITPGELAAAIEAHHDAILHRIMWSISRDFNWRKLDFAIAQEVIGLLTSAYVKLVMAYREGDFAKHPDYEDWFVFNDDVWDILADITTASDWSQIGYHPHHDEDCGLCEAMPSMP